MKIYLEELKMTHNALKMPCTQVGVLVNEIWEHKEILRHSSLFTLVELDANNSKKSLYHIYSITTKRRHPVISKIKIVISVKQGLLTISELYLY